MGKPTTDLPDSIDPGPAASAEKVDDLLAQMAGEEIDRLLSEADDPRLGATIVDPPAPPRPAAKPAAPIDDEISKQLSDLFADADPVSLPAAPASIQSAPLAGTVFTPADRQTPPPAAAIVEYDAAGLDGPILPDASTTPEERAALAPQPDDEDQLNLHVGQEDQAEGSAAYLKPLQWMNTPTEACPDRLRDLIGKIALLTLFNATAVLIYVFFRRHH
jgi:hypothetical protein